MKRTFILLFLLFVSALFFANDVAAQTTAFTYQGSLQSGGSPASGSYDLQFALYDDPSGGSQLGSTISMNGVTVTNGVFSVSLDFGGQFTGADRFLEIQVRQAGGGAFTTLSPRQRVTSSPHAIKAQTADTAANAQQLGGIAANQYVLTSDSRLTNARDPLPGSSNYIQNGTSFQTGTFNISGNGIIGGQMMANSIYSPKALFGNLSSNTSTVAAGSSTDTAIWGSSGSEVGVRGYSSANDGVYGNSTNSTAFPSAGVHGEGSNVAMGVWGKATSAVGIKGESDSNYGVWGYSAAGGGVYGSSTSAPGVTGQSQTSDGVKGTGKRGVFGSAFGAGSRGVEAYGTSWFSGDTTPLTGTTGTGIAIGSLQSAPYAGYIFAYDYSTNTAQVLALNSTGGRVGIGTTAPDQILSVNGNASKTGGGSWLTFSDERLKNIQGKLNYGLKEVMQLQPLLYEYKPGNALGLLSDGVHAGFSAQAVEKVIPEAVTKNEQGYRMLNTDPIILAMLNAIKEQQAEIEAKQEEIDRQNAINRKQSEEVAGLKAIVCRSHRKAAVCRK